MTTLGELHMKSSDVHSLFEKAKCKVWTSHPCANNQEGDGSDDEINSAIIAAKTTTAIIINLATKK